MVTVEPAVFAQNEINVVRDDVNQIFQDSPPNLNHARTNEAYVIARAIMALQDTFEWVCNTNPSRSSQTCNDWQLLLST